jgi:hypothetical protein
VSETPKYGLSAPNGKLSDAVISERCELMSARSVRGRADGWYRAGPSPTCGGRYGWTSDAWRQTDYPLGQHDFSVVVGLDWAWTMIRGIGRVCGSNGERARPAQVAAADYGRRAHLFSRSAATWALAPIPGGRALFDSERVSKVIDIRQRRRPDRRRQAPVRRHGRVRRGLDSRLVVAIVGGELLYILSLSIAIPIGNAAVAIAIVLAAVVAMIVGVSLEGSVARRRTQLRPAARREERER